MSKQEFIDKLREKLIGLPKQDVEDRLAFYSEMIDDRIEEGLTEEEAILAIGSVDKIGPQIIAEIPLVKIAKEKIRPKRRLKTWEIIFLALGSPIWISLLIAACAVVFSLYVVLWSVIISIWSVFVSLVCCVIGLITAGIALALGANAPTGIAFIGMGIACAGISVFLFYGCAVATKGVLLLTKKITFGIKNCFVGKEKSQ